MVLVQLRLMSQWMQKTVYPDCCFLFSKLEDSAITFLKKSVMPMEDWTRYFASMKKIPHSPIAKHHIVEAVLEVAKVEQTMKNPFKDHTSRSCGLFYDALGAEEQIHFETLADQEIC